MSVSKARRNRVKELWLGLPETWRTHLASGFNTFVSTFITELMAMAVTSTEFSINRLVFIGALNAAVRATIVKPSSTAIGSRVLPDPKK